MSSGERGEGVMRLQEALMHTGRELPRSTAGGNGPADGIFGSETKSEVTRFQRDHGLFVDGLAGRQTFGLLDQFMEQQEREAAAVGEDGDWEMTTARESRE
jgi:peptidoglycan hydrolase-like protein with peptidoglycan-binding domain